MSRRLLVFLAVLSLFTGSAALGEEALPHFFREGLAAKSFPPAPRLVRQTDVPMAVTLRAATAAVPEQIAAMREWNESGRLPAKAGFVRSLGEVLEVRLGGLAAKSGLHGRGVTAATERGSAWAAAFRVEAAKRLRLHLENVELPEGTTLWVYGTSGEAVGFDATWADGKGSLWAPSIDGDTVYLEVEIPADATGNASFSIREVLEVLYARGAPRQETNDDPVCLSGMNVRCKNAGTFSVIEQASAAIGQMEFIVGGNLGVCTGTLINDQQDSKTPYFLTANHCISSQSVANTLETYFDFKFNSCGSSNVSYLPAVRGASLLVTTAATDVTLLRLPSIPAGRWFMGWTTSAPANGTALHRISHPVPDGFNEAVPQLYSRTLVKTTGTQCSGRQRPSYLYSNESNGGEGGVYGGSSGSSAMLGNGQIVGQLFGSCGPDPAAGCDRRNDTVDGAFSASFDVLRPYLASTGTQPQPCVANSTTICLVNNRFSVRVGYNTGDGAKTMTAIKYTPNTGLFWFTGDDNIEVLLKMIDACSFNQRFWVFIGGTTDVEVNVTVTDSKTGSVKTYNNPLRTKFGTVTDTSAFATCP